VKKVFAAIAFLLLSAAAYAQNPLPNISYNAGLNAACTNANTACSTAVFVTGSSGSGNGPTGNGSALDVPVANYAAATVTVSGTYAGATIAFDFSDPTGGTNYFQEICARTDVNTLETGETLPSNQTRAWQCPIYGETRFRVRLSAYSSGTANVWITLTATAIDPSPVVATVAANVAGSSDPCQSSSVTKSSVAINISSATTTQLVALSAGKVVYACGFTASGTGTTDTIQFEYGTGTTCGTGTTALTGPIALAAAPNSSYGPGSTVFATASANALCAVTGGTVTNVAGVLTYVQQ